MNLVGPIGLGLLRGAHLAALLVLVGTLLFRWLVAHWVPSQRLGGHLRRTALGAGAASFLLGALWFLTIVASVTGADTISGVFAAVPTALLYLGFARLLLLRLALLLPALGILATPGHRRLTGARLAASLGLGAAALGIDPWLGHAATMGGITSDALISAELLHLAGAAAWLGGLPALMLTLATLRGSDAAPLVRRFSALSVAAVVAITLGGAVQGWFLVGHQAERWIGTAYGLTALGKTILFGTALPFALVNRLVISPLLAGPAMPVVLRRLRASVRTEAILGLAIVLLAGILSRLPPGYERPPSPARFGWPGLALPALVLVAAAAGLAAWLGHGLLSSSPKPGVPS